MTDDELRELFGDTDHIDRFMRAPELVRFLQTLAPETSTCYKCGLPWAFVKHKVIKISNSGGAFALCCYCWDHSTVDERIEYYCALWHDWKRQTPDDQPCTLKQMEGAVIIASEMTEQ